MLSILPLRIRFRESKFTYPQITMLPARKNEYLKKKKTVSPKKTLHTVLKKQHYIICELCVKPLSASVALI